MAAAANENSASFTSMPFSGSPVIAGAVGGVVSYLRVRGSEAALPFQAASATTPAAIETAISPSVEGTIVITLLYPPSSPSTASSAVTPATVALASPASVTAAAVKFVTCSVKVAVTSHGEPEALNGASDSLASETSGGVLS